MMNEKKPTWICPVCDKPATFSTLHIDGLFMDIFRKAPADCSNVKFEEDGSWYPHDENKEFLTVSATPERKPEVITSSPPRPMSSMSTTRAPSPMPVTQKTENNNDSCIDLTLDSDDDEPPPKRRASPAVPSDTQGIIPVPVGGPIPAVPIPSGHEPTSDPVPVSLIHNVAAAHNNPIDFRSGPYSGILPGPYATAPAPRYDLFNMLQQEQARQLGLTMMPERSYSPPTNNGAFRTASSTPEVIHSTFSNQQASSPEECVSLD